MGILKNFFKTKTKYVPGPTTVQKSEPWDAQKGFLQKVFSEADKLYNSPGPDYYPGNTVVSFSPETNKALEMQYNRALNGSPTHNASVDQLMSTLRGDYLYGGEGFNKAVDAASRKILPQIDSTFERAGRTGSGLAQIAKAQAISDAFAGQYGQERQNQLRSMLFAPQVANQDYIDIDRLSNVGERKERQLEEELAAAIEKYNFDQNKQRNKLAEFKDFIEGSYGGTRIGSGATPKFRNYGSDFVGATQQGGLLQGFLSML